MHLDKLEIRGFKSFKEKTVLEFPNAFTAIIGPNGSGKTNIVDAICFVLGRSRGLRVDRIDELICNGGTKSDGVSSAKVSMYLKGDDGDNRKVRRKISREIFRDGKSLYKMDGKQVSREEILEVVGDNEYNIINQNDVTRLIDMKPEERREIIDDLCGIREYDRKKEKAMKELEKVEEKLSETHIILGEKRGYLEGLKQERDEAIRYREINENLKKCRASILFHNLKKEEERKKRIEEKIDILQKEKDQSVLRIKKIRDEIAEKTKQIKGFNEEILKLEETREDGRTSELRERYVQLREELRHSEETLKALEEEALEKKKQRDEIAKEKSNLMPKISAIEEKLTSLNPKIQALEKNIKGVGFENEIDQLKSEIFELNAKIKWFENVREQNEEEIEEIKEHDEEEKRNIKELEEEYKRIVNKYEILKSKEEEKRRELTKKRGRLIEIIRKEEEIEEKVNSLQIKLTERKTELKTLEKSPSVVSVARTIMKIKPVIPGIYGIASELGSCSERRYEKALSVAAGSRIYSIVVEDEETAKKCINYLRKNKIGRATFLPLNRLNVISSKRKGVPKGALGFARDFIKCKEERFKKIFEWVFLDTLIVEDIDAAKKIGIGKERMVTLDRDLISREGAISGGYFKVKGAVFSTQDEIKKEIAELERKLVKVNDQFEDVKKEKERIKKAIENAEDELQEESMLVEKQKLTLDSLNEEISKRKRELQTYKERYRELENAIRESNEKRKELEKEIEDKEKTLKEMTTSKKRSKWDEFARLKDDYHKLSIERNSLEDEDKFLSKQLINLETELKSLNKKEKQLRTTIKETKEKISEIEKNLKKREERESGVENKITKLMNSRDELDQMITSLGEDLGRIEHSLEEINEKLNRFIVKKAKIETRFSDLKREFKEYENIKPFGENEKKISELIEMEEKLGRELAGFGFINMRAIENYELVKNELDKINERLDVLKEERQSILDFMTKVEKKKKEVFMKTFEVIKENFEEIYKELGGGKGSLMLSHLSDISKAGLIIKASPKGKKLVNLDVMSGGEKVLTCSAFLLAIQKYKPSHFYILDELDAALDKENSQKLAEMLKASKTQFILVTHNDEILKYVESIIGVSMQDGLSQIVGVKLT
jgi:chromosome segregation protein